jgi:hypothetical protein
MENVYAKLVGTELTVGSIKEFVTRSVMKLLDARVRQAPNARHAAFTHIAITAALVSATCFGEVMTAKYTSKNVILSVLAAVPVQLRLTVKCAQAMRTSSTATASATRTGLAKAVRVIQDPVN